MTCYVDGYAAPEDKAALAVAKKAWSLSRDPAKHGDRKFVLALMAENPLAITTAPDDLLGDREIMLAVVTRNGSLLALASDKLKADKEVVMAAVKQRGWALSCASPSLRADRQVVIEAVTNYGMALQYASTALRRDAEVVRAAVKQDEGAERFAALHVTGRDDYVDRIRHEGRDLSVPLWNAQGMFMRGF